MWRHEQRLPNTICDVKSEHCNNRTCIRNEASLLELIFTERTFTGMNVRPYLSGRNPISFCRLSVLESGTK
jgi:hypothetical protein